MARCLKVSFLAGVAGRVASTSAPHNNALHQTKGAWSGPRFSSEGRSLRAPFAAEPECYTGLANREGL